jgi:hypothetical protein
LASKWSPKLDARVTQVPVMSRFRQRFFAIPIVWTFGRRVSGPLFS